MERSITQTPDNITDNIDIIILYTTRNCVTMKEIETILCYNSLKNVRRNSIDKTRVK